jgi:hypothetical protein
VKGGYALASPEAEAVGVVEVKGVYALATPETEAVGSLFFIL